MRCRSTRDAAQPGTEYRPQCTKMPSLAPSYHAGSGCRRTESSVARWCRWEAMRPPGSHLRAARFKADRVAVRPADAIVRIATPVHPSTDQRRPTGCRTADAEPNERIHVHGTLDAYAHH